MKTLTQVLNEVDDYKKSVVRSCIRRIGKESILDVVNHGAESGFCGFTYYSDTSAFYRRYRESINQWVKDMAKDLGEDAVSMVVNFGCLKSEEYREDVGRCLYDGRLNDQTVQVENALAWFALEESCRLFDE